MPSMTERLAKRPLFLIDAGRQISIGTLAVLIDLEDCSSAFFEELVPIRKCYVRVLTFVVSGRYPREGEKGINKGSRD